MNNKTAVVIVAAGRGERLGSRGNGTGPKQYRSIGNTSVLAKTVEAFLDHQEIDLIQIVIHEDDKGLYANMQLSDPQILPAVEGGATRQISCLKGLEAVAKHGIANILIHDAARPFVSPDTISRVLNSTQQGRAALPVAPISATIKKLDDENLVDATIDRTKLYTAQTPQGFWFSDILALHQKASSLGMDNLTDDAAVAEWGSLPVFAVKVSDDNIKITTIEDLEQADERMTMLQNQMPIPDIRTGTGYDVHRLIEGDEIILCGVTIPFHLKLDGHSDADVGLHALTDALLGTIASGDIGSHFPPSDPKWKGARSDQFLKHACDLVQEHNGTITHMDVTLVCEAPKIGPHRDSMRKTIAEICKIEMDRVSVKATTNEKIGFIGREEGIAAIASATVSINNPK